MNLPRVRTSGVARSAVLAIGLAACASPASAQPMIVESGWALARDIRLEFARSARLDEQSRDIYALTSSGEPELVRVDPVGEIRGLGTLQSVGSLEINPAERNSVFLTGITSVGGEFGVWRYADATNNFERWAGTTQMIALDAGLTVTPAWNHSFHLGGLNGTTRSFPRFVIVGAAPGGVVAAQATSTGTRPIAPASAFLATGGELRDSAIGHYRLFVTSGSGKTISAFNPRLGAGADGVTPVITLPTGENAGGIAYDPRERDLLVAVNTAADSFIVRYDLDGDAFDLDVGARTTVATGFELLGDASIQLADRGQTLVVTDAVGAVYVLERTPTPCGPPPSIGFDAAAASAARTVEIDGDLMIVGVPDDDTVLIYRLLDTGEWALALSLDAFDLFEDPALAGSGFGTDVAIAGDRLVVGAPLLDDGAADGGGVLIFDLLRDQAGTVTLSEAFTVILFGLDPGAKMGTLVATNGESTWVLPDPGNGVTDRRYLVRQDPTDGTSVTAVDLSAPPNDVDRYVTTSVDVSGDYVAFGMPFYDQDSRQQSGAVDLVRVRPIDEEPTINTPLLRGLDESLLRLTEFGSAFRQYGYSVALDGNLLAALRFESATNLGVIQLRVLDDPNNPRDLTQISVGMAGAPPTGHELDLAGGLLVARVHPSTTQSEAWAWRFVGPVAFDVAVVDMMPATRQPSALGFAVAAGASGAIAATAPGEQFDVRARFVGDCASCAGGGALDAAILAQGRDFDLDGVPDPCERVRLLPDGRGANELPPFGQLPEFQLRDDDGFTIFPPFESGTEIIMAQGVYEGATFENVPGFTLRPATPSDDVVIRPVDAGGGGGFFDVKTLEISAGPDFLVGAEAYSIEGLTLGSGSDEVRFGQSSGATGFDHLFLELGDTSSVAVRDVTFNPVAITADGTFNIFTSTVMLTFVTVSSELNTVPTLSMQGCTFLPPSGSPNPHTHYLGPSANATIDRCVFVGADARGASNIVTGGFGGLTFEFLGGVAGPFIPETVRISNSLFIGNRAEKGGAIHARSVNGDDPSDVLEIVNCTFWANEADAWADVYPGESLDLRSNFITEPVRTVISNSVFKDNLDLSVPSDRFADLTFAYSLFDGQPSPTGLADGGGNIAAEPVVVAPPFVGADGVWGTGDDELGDLRPAPLSPVIDAGDTRALPASLTIDLAGADRVVDAIGYTDVGIADPPRAVVDIGAYEAAAGIAPPDSPDATIDGRNIPADFTDAGPISQTTGTDAGDSIFGGQDDDSGGELNQLFVDSVAIGGENFVEFGLTGNVEIADANSPGDAIVIIIDSVPGGSNTINIGDLGTSGPGAFAGGLNGTTLDANFDADHLIVISTNDDLTFGVGAIAVNDGTLTFVGSGMIGSGSEGFEEDGGSGARSGGGWLAAIDNSNTEGIGPFPFGAPPVADPATASTGLELRAPASAIGVTLGQPLRVQALLVRGLTPTNVTNQSLPPFPLLTSNVGPAPDLESISGDQSVVVTPPVPPTPCVGDADGDGDTDLDDFSVLAIQFGGPGPGADFDGSGVVDLDDFSLLAIDFGCGVEG